jgi:hypothetical protein
VHRAINVIASAFSRKLLTAVVGILSGASFRSAGLGDTLVPTTRLKLGKRAFFASDPKVFNDVPAELETCRSTVDFK